LADEVFYVVVMLAGASEMRGDADGERVAADSGEVFAKQVSCSLGVAGGGDPDHLDVVAFPVHLLAMGIFAGGPGYGVEIGDGQPEARVDVERETQRRGRPGGIEGSLRLAVEPGRPRAGGYHTAVVLHRRLGIGQAIMVAAGSAGR
jgi:hypothetical protein